MNEKKESAKEAQNAPAEFSLISNHTLLALYRNLLKCRPGASRGRRGRPNAAEFDAVAVGVTMDLAGEDHVRSMERRDLIALLAGRPKPDAQCADADVESMLHGAIGAALANKTKKSGKVALVFGSNGNGDAWRDALEVARVHLLPMIFVSAIDLARERRNHAPDNSKLEPGTELPQITVDGNDVVAVYRVAHEAIERARRDRGPTLIECAPYRVQGRLHNDPVANMEGYLKAKGLWRPALKPASVKKPRRSTR